MMYNPSPLHLMPLTPYLVLPLHHPRAARRIVGRLGDDPICLRHGRLGGMAHVPCGPEFREAFSCFVYSTEEPKGMDCIDKFQNMQQCFQKYPEVYKGELEDDEELDAELESGRQELIGEIQERKAAQQQRGDTQRRLLEEPDPAPRAAAPTTKKVTREETRPSTTSDDLLTSERESITEGQKSLISKPKEGSSAAETAVPEADGIVPKAAHDARGNSGVVQHTEH